LKTLPRQSVIFLIISGIATGLSWLCYFRALQLGPASQVAPLDKLSLPLTIVLAALFLGEKFGWQSLAGIALIGTGTYVLTR
ncbi:EamA family transporter, partial [bacterium]